MSTFRLQIGKAVRRLRTAAGYSQEGFADACKLHRTYIGAIERGEKNLTTDTIERIAGTLKLSPFDLLREAEGEAKSSPAKGA
ncbi:MAG: helix-turn-helix transcriptional regulator [Gemmatimonadales bacterium]|nr:helix-turn-helix transcriptional regulator [Gemmatimonadales bacterium]